MDARDADPGDELTTIATFASTAEAELARERLSLEGIDAFVLDSITANVMPFATGGGKVRLQVGTSDVARARECLGFIDS